MDRLALLALSLVALVAAPLLGTAADRLRGWVGQSLLIGLVLLVVVGVLPHAVAAAGPGVLAVAALGWLLPTLAERWVHARSVHGVPRTLVAVGLVGHALLDGAAIGAPGDTALGWAVILHRIPAATATWLILTVAWGNGLTLLVLGLAGVSTLIGYWSAAQIWSAHDAPAVALFSALVAGSLLHLVSPHAHDEGHEADNA